jgi:ribosomal-protein-alanine N-acetyltransferase
MLRQDNILLRPLNENDTSVLAQLANNKKIWDYLRDFFPFPYTTQNSIDFIKITGQENPQMTFAIEFEGSFCGVIGLIGQSDIYKKTAEIGYWIGEPFWNKGIATKAVNLITGYGLNQLAFLRIHTGVFEYNIGSMRVLEKNGYKKDGVFEKAVFKNGQIWNEHRFSRIK